MHKNTCFPSTVLGVSEQTTWYMSKGYTLTMCWISDLVCIHTLLNLKLTQISSLNSTF